MIWKFRIKSAFCYDEFQWICEPWMHEKAETMDAMMTTPVLRMPRPLTPCLGREADVLAVQALFFEQEARLVTLQGPGGIGKTRLAMEIAQEAYPAFADGALFLALNEVASAFHIPRLLARALHIPLFGEHDVDEQVLDWLSEKELLLVMDNYEHLLPNTAFLERLLQTAPGVRLLVTSRARLHVKGEVLYAVEGLAYPVDQDDWHLVKASPAVHLFLERAAHLGVTFDETELEDIVQFCRFVQGMPLPIVLAAYLTTTRSPREILEASQRSFTILSVEHADLPPRQRSLRVILDQSWWALSSEAREALHRLILFRAPFTVEEAQRAADCSPTLFQYLVDTSLLLPYTRDYYTIHEFVRQYVQSWSFEDALHSQARRRFVKYFVSVADSFSSADEDDDVAFLFGNLLQALTYAIEEQMPQEGETLLGALVALREAKSDFAGAADLLDMFISSPLFPSLSAPSRIRWYERLGDVAFKCGRLLESETALQKGLALLDEPFPTHTFVLGMRILGELGRQGVYRLASFGKSQRPDERAAVASRLYERLGQCYFFHNDALRTFYAALRSLNKAERLGFSPELARAQANVTLGLAVAPLHRLAAFYATLTKRTIAHIEDDEAIAWAEEILALYHTGLGQWALALTAAEHAIDAATRIGDARRIEEALVVPATVAHFKGEFEEARQAWKQLRERALQRNDPQVEAWALTGEAETLLLRSHFDEAIPLLERASMLLKRTQDDINKISYHGGLALIAAMQGDGERVLQQTAAALPLAERDVSSFSILEGVSNLTEANLMCWAQGEWARTNSRQLCRVLARFAKTFPFGVPRAALWKGWLVWKDGDQAQAVRWWRKGWQAATRLEMRHDAAWLAYVLRRVAGEVLSPAEESEREVPATGMRTIEDARG